MTSASPLKVGKNEFDVILNGFNPRAVLQGTPASSYLEVRMYINSRLLFEIRDCLKPCVRPLRNNFRLRENVEGGAWLGLQRERLVGMHEDLQIGLCTTGKL